MGERGRRQKEDSYEIGIEATPTSQPSPSGLVPEDTFAELQFESNNGSPAGPTNYEGTYKYTGDQPSGGWAYNPKYGRVTYAPVYTDGGAPLGQYHRGLTVSGAGTLTVELIFGAAWIASGHQDIRLSVYKNGVEALFTAESSEGGLRFIGYTGTVSGSFAVVAGDVIAAHFYELSGATPGIITFEPVIGQHLRISGSLSA